MTIKIYKSDINRYQAFLRVDCIVPRDDFKALKDAFIYDSHIKINIVGLIDPDNEEIVISIIKTIGNIKKRLTGRLLEDILIRFSFITIIGRKNNLPHQELSSDKKVQEINYDIPDFIKFLDRRFMTNRPPLDSINFDSWKYL